MNHYQGIPIEKAGRSRGIPAIVLPDRQIVDANGLIISKPCSRRLASDRLIVSPSDGRLQPVVGIDYRGPWQLGFTTRVPVSPAGMARLPDGTVVHVGADSGDASSGQYNSTILQNPGGITLGPAGTDDSGQPSATPGGIIGTDQGDYPTGTSLGPAGTSSQSTLPGGVVGPAAINEDSWSADAENAANQAAASPWFQGLKTVLICVLVGVGLWFFWPLLMHVRG